MKDKYISRLIKDIQCTEYGDSLKNSAHYSTFYIRKKSGGWRRISAPEHPLKRLLKRLTKILYDAYQPTDCAMGFVRGRSVISNTTAHIGQKYVFCIDLKSFFSSISYQKIFDVFQNEPFSLSVQECEIFAGICCIGNPEEKDINKCFLPQGSPASPILSNFVCKEMDEEIRQLAIKNNLNFSRYADDITFSGSSDIFNLEAPFYLGIKQIVEKYGFLINEKKTRLQQQFQRQDVTGITVNKKANVSKKFLRETRSLLYIWERFGYAEAQKRHKEKHKSIKKLDLVINGKLRYMKMIKGSTDPTYKALHKRYEALRDDLKEKRKREEEARNHRISSAIFELIIFAIIFTIVIVFLLWLYGF